MSPQCLPQLTLASLLTVAACVLLGGALLARRSETIRVPRERDPLRDFARAFAEQTLRLERLYESHLRRIAEEIDARNPATSRAAGERIVGLRQISVLHPDETREPDRHVQTMKPAPGERWPEPSLRTRSEGLPRPQIRLSVGELLGARSARDGWLDRPGEPLFYWQRRDWENVAVVFSIDRLELATTLDAWFHAWLANGASGAFAGLAAAGGPDRLLGTAGHTLAASGPTPAQPDRPDFLLPLRTRLGTWQLASWDRYETRTSYHAPTLAASGTLALLIALLGFSAAIQHRRALALAAQRVSFVNRVSHELRTPLTNILLNVDLAAESSEDAPREAARRLALVQEEARRLGRLIDNVLTFSRHEQGAARVQPRACVPASVIAAVLAHFAPSFQRHAFEVHTRGELTAACLLDADALAQIIANLLSNAEKYVPGGHLEITGTLHDGALTLVVADQGPGIPMEAAERIFRPFERLDSRVNEGTSGTGLGLAIARDLAVRMGGSLRLIPSPQGAAFELRVPAPPAPEPRSISAA